MEQEEQEEKKPEEDAPAKDSSSSKVDVVGSETRTTEGDAVAEATGAEASDAAPDATGPDADASDASPGATDAVKAEEAEGRRVSSDGPSSSMVDDDLRAGGEDTTTPSPPNEKHIVRCGFRGGSIAQFPGNLQYVDEMKDYRGAYLSAKRMGDNEECDRLVDHFLARYAFVDDRTKKYLTEDQAREKMHKSLGDPRKDVRSKKKGEVRQLRDRRSLAPPETVRSDRHVNEEMIKAALAEEKKKEEERKKSDAKKKAATEPTRRQSDLNAKGKHIVRCGFRGGSIAKFEGNLLYVDEMSDFRGTYLKTRENSDERKEITRYFLSRYLFVDHYKNKPITAKEAESKIHSGLGDQRREMREGRKVKEDINRRLRLFRAAEKEAKSRKSSVKKEPKVEPSFEEEEDDGEDDDDGDESDSVPDTDSPDKLGRLVVRCGQHKYRNLPGNRAYFEEMRDLRSDYLAASPNSEDRKWIVDNFLGNYIFVWGPTNKRLSKKEAKEKIVISLRDSRKGIRVESSEDEEFDHSTIATQQTMDYDEQSAEESAEDNETPAEEEDDDDDDDGGGDGDDEQVADDDDQSMSDGPNEKNAPKKKIVVRLGQGHTKLPGNIQYLQEMTDKRGGFLELEEDDPKRQRIIERFVNKYTFVNDNGKHLSEELAWNKVRLSLRDARMPTRMNPYNKKRKR